MNLDFEQDKKSNDVFQPEFSFFSDTLIFSWPIDSRDDYHSLTLICTIVATLQEIFFDRLYLLLRGVVHVGSLYHDNPIIYGEGLIQAYLFEKDKIIYPRIVFTSTAEKYFYSLIKEYNIYRLIHYDDFHGISFLESKRSWIARVPNDSEMDKLIIQQHLYGNYSSNIKDKWKWFANEYNKRVLEPNKLEPIKIPVKMIYLIFKNLFNR